MSQKDTLPKVRAVDLFCGIGGLTHGLNLAGIQVKAGYDNDQSCRYAYETNNPRSKFFSSDVRKLRFRHLAPHYRGADVIVLVGCAPCQPFSAYTRKTRNPNKDDCSLIGEFSRLIHEGLPDLISMENVPGLVKHEAFSELLSTLKFLGYRYKYDVLSCINYGVPQNRKRLVLLASRIGAIRLPCASQEKKTVADFIHGLPAIKDGETSEVDSAHVTLALSKRNQKRIRESQPGGSWKDWPKGMVNRCHNKAYYPASYGRMRWDFHAPTITTQFCYYSTGRFGHPEQHRTISVREAALLQTFPQYYQLIENGKSVAIHEIARHIGNAVPVRLAQAIGNSIMEAAHA